MTVCLITYYVLPRLLGRMTGDLGAMIIYIPIMSIDFSKEFESVDQNNFVYETSTILIVTFKIGLNLTIQYKAMCLAPANTRR